MGKRKSHNNNPARPKNKRARAHVSERAALLANIFFLNSDIFLMHFLFQCELLTIFTLSKTGHHARSIVKSFFASNLRCLVSFFVSDAHVDRFYETLEATSSGIAGSVVTSILTAPYRHAWAPSNLNIFIPIGFLKEWVSVLSYIGLKQTKEQAGVSRQYRHTAGAHVVFESVIEGFTIELTESCDDSILSPLIAATNTFATNLATCTTLFSLYPYLLRNKRALEGWHPTPVRKAVTIGRRGYRSSFSTASWDAACGWNCPVKWRYVKDVKGVGVFHWGGSTNQHDDDSFVGVPVTDNHMKWRLGDTCTNKNCPWNRANYFANRHSA